MPHLAPIHGTLRAPEAVRERLTVLRGPGLGGKSFFRLLDDLDAIDALALAFHRGFEAGLSGSGLDLRTVASMVLDELRKAQAPSVTLKRALADREVRARIRRAHEDDRTIRLLAGIVDQAFQFGLAPDGRINFRNAAAFSLREIRETLS